MDRVTLERRIAEPRRIFVFVGQGQLQVVQWNAAKRREHAATELGADQHASLPQRLRALAEDRPRRLSRGDGKSGRVEGERGTAARRPEWNVGDAVGDR